MVAYCAGSPSPVHARAPAGPGQSLTWTCGLCCASCRLDTVYISAEGVGLQKAVFLRVSPAQLI